MKTKKLIGLILIGVSGAILTVSGAGIVAIPSVVVSVAGWITGPAGTALLIGKDKSEEKQ